MVAVGLKNKLKLFLMNIRRSKTFSSSHDASFLLRPEKLSILFIQLYELLIFYLADVHLSNAFQNKLTH